MNTGTTTPTSILNELGKAVKMHNFYPSGHPQFDTAMGKCFEHIKHWLDDNGAIKFSITHRGFKCGSDSIGLGSKDIGDLAKKFFIRKIKELEITTRLSCDDVKELVDILRLEPKEISAAGGIEELFAARGVDGLLLNEMRYEGLKELKAKLQHQQLKISEEMTLDDENELEEIAEEENNEEEIGEQDDENEAVDESLMEMVEKIKTEDDLLKFNDLSVRIVERCAALMAVNALDEVLPAIFIFLELTNPEDRRGRDFNSMAKTQLRSLLEAPALLRRLAERVGSKDEIKREAIEQCLLIAEDTSLVINILLDDAVQAAEATVRRNLFNTLKLFKKKLLPFIEERIKSGVWYEVRQMAALLGEIGDPDNLPLLKEIYGADDVKIKKEALKSLARIPSVEAAAFLSEALGEDDASLVCQAIVSLGFLRDSSAVDNISEIALKWEPFNKTHNLQKEAIRALGNIASPASCPALTRILMRKSWFSKQYNEELRNLAAKSLGMIGDDEAYKALEKAMKNSEGTLYDTCKRAIERKDGEN